MRTRRRWDIKKKKGQDCWFDEDAILKQDAAANGSEIVPSLC